MFFVFCKYLLLDLISVSAISSHSRVVSEHPLKGCLRIALPAQLGCFLPNFRVSSPIDVAPQRFAIRACHVIQPLLPPFKFTRHHREAPHLGVLL